MKTIDVSDFEKLPSGTTGPRLTRERLILHEVAEQVKSRNIKLKPSADPFDKSHDYALRVETFDGWTRRTGNIGGRRGDGSRPVDVIWSKKGEKTVRETVIMKPDGTISIEPRQPKSKKK